MKRDPRTTPVPEQLQLTRLDKDTVILSHSVDGMVLVDERLGQFPPAEREVVTLMLAGHSDEEIAGARGCSKFTVGDTLKSAYRRAGVGNRAELAAWLRAKGGALD